MKILITLLWKKFPEELDKFDGLTIGFSHQKHRKIVKKGIKLGTV